MEKTALSKDEYRNKAARYCAAAEHCESEVREKLRQWGAEAKNTDEIVDFLIDNNYINEERYARAFAHDKLRYNGWGKMKIRYMLMGKRISRSAIEAALAALDENEYEEVLRKVAEKKKGASPMELARFLRQRGFSDLPSEE